MMAAVGEVMGERGKVRRMVSSSSPDVEQEGEEPARAVHAVRRRR